MYMTETETPLASSTIINFYGSTNIKKNSPLGSLEAEGETKRLVLQYPEKFIDGENTPNHMIVFFFNQNKSTKFPLNTVIDKLTIIANSEEDRKDFIAGVKKLGDKVIENTVIKIANMGILSESVRARLVTDELVIHPGFIFTQDTSSKINAGNIAESVLGTLSSSISAVNQERTNLTVAMYMPNDITENITINYNNTSMSGTSGAIAGSLQGIGNIASGVLSNFMNGQDFFRGVTMNDFGLGSILQRGLGGLIGAGVDAAGKPAITAGLGIAANPFMEIIFDNMDFRKFRFNFKFAPNSKKESEIARSIIKAFKFNSAPELASDFLNTFFMVPGTFDIKYFSKTSSGTFKENDYLNKISTCVCTGVSVNYTGNDGNIFTAFESENDNDPGAPVVMDLSLEFTELELITKKRITEGF